LNRRGRLLHRARPQADEHCLNALTTLQLAFSVFLESGPVAISF
jgi:hypothetical protein